jgi:hypothetical protein
MINSQNDETLKPSAFIGQSKKQSGGKQSNSREAGIGTEQAGMKQAEQQRVLDDFKVGIYNILVCTSVAEEVSMYFFVTPFSFHSPCETDVQPYHCSFHRVSTLEMLISLSW